MMQAETYEKFIARKRVEHVDSGFDPPDKLINGKLFPWQRDVQRLALRRGRSSLFLDTGLGKTALQLSWADAIYRHLNKDVLILAPLSVGKQTEREAVKFAIDDCRACRDASEVKPGITVTNYERLHRFDTSRFGCDYCGYSSLVEKAAEIEAVWGEGDYSWQMRTTLPHATFEILEDGEKFCRGLVISLSDIPSGK